MRSFHVLIEWILIFISRSFHINIRLSFRNNSSLEIEQGIDSVKLDDVEFIQIRYTDVPGRFLAKYYLSDKEGLYDFLRCGIGAVSYTHLTLPTICSV